MMRKKIVSLCMALVLCLSLLPATALADGVNAPNTLYVGGTLVSSNSDGGYWTTDAQGKLTESTANDNWNVKYDPSTATLTLSGATIKGGSDVVSIPYGSGIYAQGSNGQSVTLTIKLIGENTITGTFGIYVNAEINASSYGTNATLTIMGDNNGSLEVSGSNNGIYVKSGTGNASLNINDASVVASSSSSYFGYAGVYVQSSMHATSSPQLSLKVNGGSLTASGGDGISFNVGSSGDIGATTSLTISDNAIVRAENGINAYRVDKPTPSGTGIVFNDKKGTVYDDVTLDESLTIAQGETLTIPEGSTLTVPEGKILTNNGTIDNSGTLTNNGTVTNNGTLNVNEGGKLEGETTGGSGTVVNTPTITAQPESQSVTEGNTATFTVAATGENLSYQWQQSTDNGQSWTNISGAISSTYTTDAATLAMNNYQYQCVVSNSAGSVTSSAAPLTVNAATVSVTGVTLSQNEAHLYYNRTPNTLTLTATVAPANATNKAVTWTSSNPSVATVENGVVTALACGTAVITATAADGSGASASCTVTVSSYLPPANPNYRITVEATQGGTVTADPTAAKAGTTVTLTPVPHRGYQVGTVAVTDRFGDAVAVTEQADGTYTFTMPNGQVTVTVTFAETPLPFTDVTEGDWFYDAVRCAYETGLMDGVGDSLFAPNSETTRAQLVTILYRLAGQPAVSGDVAFTDVESGLWYSNAVAWAAQKGIVNGVSETEFSPSGDLTREQLATILFRYAESAGYDVSASADLSGFPDAGDIQSYATQALSWAVAEGLLQGFEDDSLQPGGTATRAQIATILMRFLAAAPTA